MVLSIFLTACHIYPKEACRKTAGRNVVSEKKVQMKKRRRQRTSSSGLLSKIFSILSITSGVNLGMTSMALRFSVTCSGLDAPRMTVDVLGFFATHAKASAETVVSSSGKQGSEDIN